MNATYAEAVPMTDVQGILPLAVPALAPHRGLPETAVTGSPQPGADIVPIDRGRRRQMEGWTARFLQAAVEIVGGERPVSQLLRWSDERVYRQLQRRADYVARAAGQSAAGVRVGTTRPKLASVHACFVEEWVVEVAARVTYGERCRALAGRFERADDRTGPRWVCTALEWS